MSTFAALMTSATALFLVAYGDGAKVRVTPAAPRLEQAAMAAVPAKPTARPSPNCLIVVDAKTFVDRPCPTTVDPDLVTINTGETASTEDGFVYINRDPGQPIVASWSGGHGSTHAQEPLGVVTVEGRCWVNARARLCVPG